MLTKEEFNAILNDRGVLIIDGALATELEVRGHDLNHPLWSAKVLKDDPQSIESVHLDYYLAGADIAITASYQASTQGLKDHFQMSSEEAEDAIKKSVRLVQQARDEAYSRGIKRERRLLVAGSVGPFGAYLADGSEYRGDYIRTTAELQAFHKPRIKALVEAGVDLLAIETMPNFEEVQAVLDLLRNEFPGSIGWLSCTTKDEMHISDGTSLHDVLDLVDPYSNHIVAFGVNCVSSDVVSATLQHLKSYSTIPLLCYPNSGEQWDAVSKTWKGREQSESNLQSQIHGWKTSGATLIGGCCKTGPDYVRSVLEALNMP